MKEYNNKKYYVIPLQEQLEKNDLLDIKDAVNKSESLSHFSEKQKQSIKNIIKERYDMLENLSK